MHPYLALQVDGAQPHGVARLSSVALDNLLSHERIARENLQLREVLRRRSELIAKSPKMLEIVRKAQRLGERDTSVLILGETGTGKELIARTIHDASPRSQKPFIAFNCSMGTPELIENELFGHVKGAYTDATREHKGRFELASGGSLFLDEVGDMPLSTQAKILRVLQERCVERIGGEKLITVDIRLISATNKRLDEMVEKSLFRQDLYYRIAVFTLDLPSLRERGEDVVEIARSLLNDTGLELDDAASKALLRYSWPGNVRELQNVIENATFNAGARPVRAATWGSSVSRSASSTRP